MGQRLIEVVELLVHKIHAGGYQQRALEDDIYAEKQKRIAVEKDRDHWKTARQEAIAAGELMQAEIETLRQQLRKAAGSVDLSEDSNRNLRAEIETLKGAMAADDKRLRDAEERVWPGRTLGCDAPDAMADEILGLRKQLADAQRAASDEFTERQVLTVEQQQDAAIWQQQVDGANAEVKYLRDRLDEERSVSAGLRQKLTAAEAAVSLQRAGIERLNKVVVAVRSQRIYFQGSPNWRTVDEALDELDAGNSEPEGGK